MFKKAKAALVLATVAAVGTGVAFYLRKKRVCLNVSELENAVLRLYPEAEITSIEKTMAKSNLYMVKATIAGKEYRIFATSCGKILNTLPSVG
ncbi:MAG: hypothetical protein BWY15_00548 [Firmicutes bacterium ADurb.Bin193]|nr:MAG: hypothetical protein BWY15_00548 [Firmicutes bacterium ADurb.Bin193]